MEVKPNGPCLDCEERHFRCHSECQKYSDFLREKDDFYKKQTADKGSLEYNAYAVQKRRRQMDNAAKRGFKKPNYQKARYR